MPDRAFSAAGNNTGALSKASTPSNLQRDLETALGSLVKLTKAFTIYPADHPALATVAEDAVNAFQPLLNLHRPRPCHVTRNGFSIEGEGQTNKGGHLSDFALRLVERRIRHLLFLPELTRDELILFARELARPAEDLLRDGSLPERLLEQGVKGIWINETSLDQIREKQQQELETPTSLDQQERPEITAFEQASPTDTEGLLIRVRELLELLKEPLSDAQHAGLLDELGQRGPSFLQFTGITGSLLLLSLLLSQQNDSTRSRSQRRGAESLLDRLLQEELRKTLVDAVADPRLKPSQQRALARLLVSLEIRIAPQLLGRLNAERDAIIRRRYTAILAHMGEPLFPLLEKDLQHSQWYLVRNAIHVLGETRLESALPLLRLALLHPEVRVRKALVRAFSSVGSNAVIPCLIQLSRDPDQELQRLAIMALGGLGKTEAIPPLVKLLNKPDPFGKQTELKLETIRAMAAIRSPQAILPLLNLARRRNLLRLSQLDSLRAEAILAVGQLGNAHLLPLLEKLGRSSRGPVSRALKQATAQLRK